LLLFGKSECCEDCEHPMRNTAENNQMLHIDIRDNDNHSINRQEIVNENSLQNEENNELNKLSNSKGQVEFSDEHTQRSQHTPFYIILILKF
jgi:hypothetical protein